ncbi:MAG TPA: hypothetical protein VKA42_00945, partial [Acidimicrobiales bacterium]|nr:hypothetical protein [Acidimicrobiales bacterium]
RWVGRRERAATRPAGEPAALGGAQPSTGANQRGSWSPAVTRRRPRPASWADVARLHPAASSPPPGPEADVGPEPGALAAATVALAEAWPWSRLRADPSLVDVPGGLPEPHVIRWMDDGMWARWLLSTFPTIDDLVAAVWGLLPDRVASAVVEAVDGAPGGAS